MIQQHNKINFEWTVSLGNLVSILSIVITVGGAIIYVGRIEAKVDKVDDRVTNSETINIIRKQSRDQQIQGIDDRLKNVEKDVKLILYTVTKDPRDEQNR